MNYNMNSQTELTDLIVESKNREKSRECWNMLEPSVSNCFKSSSSRTGPGWHRSCVLPVKASFVRGPKESEDLQKTPIKSTHTHIYIYIHNYIHTNYIIYKYIMYLYNIRSISKAKQSKRL